MVELLRTFGICGLYQRRESGCEGAGVKKQENMLGRVTQKLRNKNKFFIYKDLYG